VSELAPGDPSPYIAIAEMLFDSNDIKGARAELVIAEGKVDNLQNGKDEAWRRVVMLYARMGALTWTEDAIARAKLEQDPIAVETAQIRSRYGAPKGSKIVAPEDEAAQVNASKYGEAEKTLVAAEKKWPGAPGLLAARCNLNVNLGQTAAARAACDKAVAAHPRASWALYLSGIIALKDASGTKTGIDKLKKAIEVDPELGQAWRTLAKAYARANDKAAIDQLAKDYQAKFGTPLPR
jgi:tetratricopeptide (TPR) repeat protein